MAILVGVLSPASALASPLATPVARSGVETRTQLLYHELGLEGQMDPAAFDAGFNRIAAQGVSGGVVAIADLTQPSTAKRLVVIDLDAKQVLLRTYVAHGQNSGDLTATRFSNTAESHQSSRGLYRVGATFRSPKHGAALLLDGLDRLVNDKARVREIIIHGSDYVSEAFIAARGRLGRSWGCPAVPREAMPQVIAALGDGGLLYVYGG